MMTAKNYNEQIQTIKLHNCLTEEAVQSAFAVIASKTNSDLPPPINDWKSMS